MSIAFEPVRWRCLPPFRPYQELLDRLAHEAAWPHVARYREVLGADVDFVVPTTRLAAGLDASDVDGSYVGWCIDGRVPTREGNVHDLMNALTWARFPTAKQALCRRQMAVAQARGRDTNRLRSKLQDRLAMLDEGGILVVDAGDRVGIDGCDGERIFGHGLLEDLVQGRLSRGLRLPVCSDDDNTVALALTDVDVLALTS